jgi:hypothetical protein
VTPKAPWLPLFSCLMNHSTRTPARAPFTSEAILEDYLESQLSHHLSHIGQNLLIIGRQIGGRIDLLAIDATGVTYVIELKLNEADSQITTQVLVYRRWLKRLNREKLISVVASGRLNIDLEAAFQRHFGHALPETVNESQVLMIIAASIHPDTAEAILELQDSGISCTTFRYVVQPEAVSLIPCCRDDENVEEGTHIGTKRTAFGTRARAAIPARASSHRVNIGEDVRQFWRDHAEDFTPFVTFNYVYERYEHWVQTQAAEGLSPRLRQWGQFARQLHALVIEAGDWMRVYVPPGNEIDAYETIEVTPSWRTSIRAGYRIVAYARKPVERRSES